MTKSSADVRGKRGFRWKPQDVLTVVSILASVVLGLYVLHVQASKTRLDFSVSDRTPLFEWQQQYGPKFKLIVNDREVEKASIVTVSVENSGNVDLVPFEPGAPTHEQNPMIVLRCAPGCQILSADWDQSSGDASNVFVPQSVTDQSATFLVKLMNKGATARFLVYLADCEIDQPIECTAKGKGIRSKTIPNTEDDWRTDIRNGFIVGSSVFVAVAVAHIARQIVARRRPGFTFFVEGSNRWRDQMRNLAMLVVAVLLWLTIFATINEFVDFVYKEFLV